MKLQTKFSLWMMVLVTIIVMSGGSLTLVSERNLLLKELSQQQDQALHQMAKLSLESYYQNDLILMNFIRTLQFERGFVSAYFVDTKSRIKIHSDPSQIGKKEDSKALGSMKYLVQSEPIRVSGDLIGWSKILYSTRELGDYLESQLMISIKRIIAVMLVALGIGFLGSFILARTMVSPIQEIVNGMRKISDGHLETIPLKERKDELGWLGNEINGTVHKLKELDDMKQNFFSRITHELRSPLIAIDGLVGMIIRGMYGDVPPKQKELLLTAHNNSNRLKRLVDDLLTNARLEAKREQVYITEFDILNPVKDVHMLYTAVAQEKKLEFKSLAPSGPIKVMADLEKVEHVLINLVSNAFKFTKSGYVGLIVEDQDSHVKISVADTGLGIPDSEKEKVFNKFFRSGHSKKIKGTGLGLNIVKDLVELQGGKIVVLDNPDGGTVFSFTLPKKV